MDNNELLKVFAKSTELFEEGARTLVKEAKTNGYSMTLTGLTTFLDNCNLRTDILNFYTLCIPFAINSHNEVILGMLPE